MMRIAVALLTLSTLAGCGHIDARGGGLSAAEQDQYAVFYTPTHAFQCMAGNLFGTITIDMVPGVLFGGGDLSEKPLSVFESRGRTETMLGRDAIGLRLGQQPASLMHWFLIVNSNGDFAVPGFPIGLYSTNHPSVLMNPEWNWKCTNKAGLRPFEVTRKLAGNK